MKVLLADDSKTIRTVVQMIFHKRDVELVTVASGQEALDHARQDRPDVILADMHMEPGDGPWLATKAGSEVSLQGVPVILLTRGNDPPSPDRISEVGAAATLAKPFTSDELLNLVEEFAVEAPRSATGHGGHTREVAVEPDEPEFAAAAEPPAEDADDVDDDWMDDDDSGDVSDQAAAAVAEEADPGPSADPAPDEQSPQHSEPGSPRTSPRISSPAAFVEANSHLETPLLAALRQAGRVFEKALASSAGDESSGGAAITDPQMVRRMVHEALAERPPATQHAASVSRQTTDAAQVKVWIEEALEVAKAEWLESARRAAGEIARQAATDAAEAMRGPLSEAARKAAIEAARQGTAGGGGLADDTAAAEKVAWEVIPDLAERVLWELLPDVASDLADEVRKRV